MPEERSDANKDTNNRSGFSNKALYQGRADNNTQNSILPSHGDQRLDSIHNNRFDTYGLTAPEKEMELLNKKYVELQNFIEENKKKIQGIEHYDELLNENMLLKEKLESIRRSNVHLENNSLYAETLVKFQY